MSWSDSDSENLGISHVREAVRNNYGNDVESRGERKWFDLLLPRITSVVGKMFPSSTIFNV